MGWESRKNVERYYTRSRRVNGRVLREYVGTVIVAQLAEKLDRQTRLQHEAEREQFKEV